MDRHEAVPHRAAARLVSHAPYFHDGSAATLGDVVDHYDSVLCLGLDPGQKQDLVEFLRPL